MERRKSSTILHLLRLGRELRYRALPELVGCRIAVASLDAIGPALRALVAPWLPPDARWHPNKYLAVALAKYGIVDTSFDAPAALLDHPATQIGVPVLRAHGMVPKRGERGDDLGSGLDGLDGRQCLEQLVEELDERRCALKLFLEDERPAELHNSVVISAAREGRPLALPRDYFPRELAVTDACVTNAPFIWFNTHFYF